MKVFISQPMKGKTNEQIKQERNALVEAIEKKGDIVIDSILSEPPSELKTEALWYLGESIKLLATVDAIVLMKDWTLAKGCLIERHCADQYGVKILNENYYLNS